MVRAILTALLVSLACAFLAAVGTFTWLAWTLAPPAGGYGSVYIGVLIPPALSAAIPAFGFSLCCQLRRRGR
jgi:hypothetical protein